MNAYIVVRITYDDGDGVRLTADIDEAGAMHWGDEGVLLQVPVDLGKIVDEHRAREAKLHADRVAYEEASRRKIDAEIARQAARSARAVRGPAALAALGGAKGGASS